MVTLSAKVQITVIIIISTFGIIIVVISDVDYARQ